VFSSPQPKPVMKIENVSSVIDGIFKNRLIKKKSEYIDPFIGLENDLNEDEKKKLRRFRKKMKKYLE